MRSLFLPNIREIGQGLVEYALILVLVALVVIAALMTLGPVIGNVFSQINSSLSGLSTDGGGVVELSPADCSAQESAFNAALAAYNACLAANDGEEEHCEAQQNALDQANTNLEACTLP